MKLHEMSYTEGARRERKRIGRGHGSDMVKHLVKVKRDKTLAAAVVFV